MNFAKSLSTPSVTASENTENRESLAFYFEVKSIWFFIPLAIRMIKF